LWKSLNGAEIAEKKCPARQGRHWPKCDMIALGWCEK